MAVLTSYLLLVAGGALLVAFLADVVARRVGLPDILFLLGVGVLVGPILHLGQVSTILAVAPYLGTAALALILFAAGMDLRHHELGGLPTQATLIAGLSVGLSMVIVFPLAYVFLTGGSVILSLLFAGALSCTSSAVVVPVASRMSLPSRAKSLVHLSSALEDTIAIIIVTTLMLVDGPSAQGVSLLVTIALPLPLGLAGGVAGGLFWIEIARRYQSRPYFSMATVGFLFSVVGAVEALGGAGILSALVLGIILGNAQALRDWLKWKGDVTLLPQIHQFQTELAFLLRAFFMLILGMLMVFSGGYEWLLLVGGIITSLLVATRASVVESFLRLTGSPRSWNLPLTALAARGLTSAVLVVLPVTAGLVPASDAESFLDPTLIVVVATVAITSGGVLLYERIPSIRSGQFGAAAPPRRPMTDEERHDLYRPDDGRLPTTSADPALQPEPPEGGAGPASGPSGAPARSGDAKASPTVLPSAAPGTVGPLTTSAAPMPEKGPAARPLVSPLLPASPSSVPSPPFPSKGDLPPADPVGTPTGPPPPLPLKREPSR